jgi:hypothetical protein
MATIRVALEKLEKALVDAKVNVDEPDGTVTA